MPMHGRRWVLHDDSLFAVSIFVDILLFDVGRHLDDLVHARIVGVVDALGGDVLHPLDPHEDQEDTRADEAEYAGQSYERIIDGYYRWSVWTG